MLHETKRICALNMLLNEMGQAAGKYELAKASYEDTLAFTKKAGYDVEKEVDNYKSRYDRLQSVVKKYGKTQRKDMPVIQEKDVKQLQGRLKAGTIDINKPFAESGDPFPEGISGDQAKVWLKNGLRDGEKKDDIIKVQKKKIPVGSLIPIQRQIYIDKALLLVLKFGVNKSSNFIFNGPATFIVSSDNRIIDGHHRWTQGVLLDPKKGVNCLVIDLPINKLLPMTLSYGDAIGNIRNA